MDIDDEASAPRPLKQCRFCERRFSKTEHLKRHQRTRKASSLGAEPLNSALLTPILCVQIREKGHFDAQNATERMRAGMQELALLQLSTGCLLIPSATSLHDTHEVTTLFRQIDAAGSRVYHKQPDQSMR